MSNVQDDPAKAGARANAGIRSLLVHVEAAPDASARLHVAVDLARHFDATLLGLGVEMFQAVDDPYGMLGGEWLMALQKLVEEDLKRSEEIFKAKTQGINAEWLGIETIPAQAIAIMSRCADLIIAGGAPLKAKDAYRAASTAELVMMSGRPVLVAPPAGAKFHGDAVVVAWKDTRESRRAVADSLPFLKGAKDVVVLEVCEKAALEDAKVHTDDVVTFLRRHGVTARAKAVAARPDAVSTELQNEAMSIGADLIVAGAYGHSRLGEWAFGGVTHDLLNAPERFVLLSH